MMIRMSTATRALLLGVGVLLAPPEACAQRVQGSVDMRIPGGSVSHSFPSPPPMIRPPMQSVAPAPVAPPRGFPSPNRGPFPGPSHERFRFRGHRTIYSSSVVYYGVPYPVPYAVPYDYSSAPYYDPTPSDDPYSAYGAPSGDVSTLAPDASSSPGVIQYSTGRYELRGDGVVAPYQWVWVPNPPPAPPTAPPQSLAISSPPAPPAPEPPARQVTVYRWVDGEGVVHFTDSLDAVPQEYRSQAKPAS